MDANTKYVADLTAWFAAEVARVMGPHTNAGGSGNNNPPPPPPPPPHD